jgi:F-type H+-transporting ATPase subunit epsilon
MVNSPSSRSLRCVIVTPEETILDRSAEFVALPLYDGELGVGSGHAPMIGRLGCGELRIVEGGQTERYYVDGGFVQVADNVASVLTNRALPLARLNASNIEQAIEQTLARKAAGDDAIRLRDRDLQQLRAQLRVARRR